MTERIIPTTYGPWWARYPGNDEYSIVPIVWMQHGLYALCEKSKGIRDPRDMDIEWIAPVAMPEEVAALRKQLADLQQTYDHVVQCEQNRCREVIEYQDELTKVKKHNEALLDQFSNWLAKESTINSLGQVFPLQEKISDAPLAYCSCETEGGEDYTIVLGRIEGHHTKVRLVCG